MKLTTNILLSSSATARSSSLFYPDDIYAAVGLQQNCGRDILLALIKLTFRRSTRENGRDSLDAEVAADGAHGGLGRLGGPQHLAPLEHHVHPNPHHAHHGARRLGTYGGVRCPNKIIMSNHGGGCVRYGRYLCTTGLLFMVPNNIIMSSHGGGCVLDMDGICVLQDCYKAGVRARQHGRCKRVHTHPIHEILALRQQ